MPDDPNDTLSGVGFGVGYQLAQIARGHAGGGHQHVGKHRHRGDRRQVFLQVVRQVAIGADRHRHVYRRQQHRVAVGRGARCSGRTDGAAGTAAVVDDELLPGHLRQLGHQRPRHRVGAAARRKRHDHPHCLGRPVLGDAGHCGTQGGQGQQGGQSLSTVRGVHAGERTRSP